MKLSKDEIEEVVGDVKAAIKADPLRGPVIEDCVRRVLTRKFGEPKPVNPYDGWHGIVRDYRGASVQEVSRVPVALAELVPELWEAAVKLDADYTDYFCEPYRTNALALRSVLTKIKEASDGR